MSKAVIFTPKKPPLPTGSRRGIRCFSLPVIITVYAPTPNKILPTISRLVSVVEPLPLFCLYHFGRLSATLCLYLSLSFFSSCTPHPAPVTEALRHAGPNRQGLKQLLAHYAQNPADSLKYRAACFLVENMPWHYGKKVTPLPNLWELFLLEDSLVRPWLQNSSYYKNDHGLHGYKYGAKKMLVRQAIGNSTTEDGFHPDITTIGADLLRQNIETAFEAWESGWYPNLTFGEFCEYILPYRFNTEPVFPIRRQLRDHFMPLLQHDSLKGSQFTAIDFVQQYTAKFGEGWNSEENTCDLGFFNIIYWPSQSLDCTHHASLIGQMARTVGIPAAEVLIPCWRDTDLGHSMVLTQGPDGKQTLFTAIYQTPGRISIPHNPQRATKLYKRTYAIQSNTPAALRLKGEELPPFFENPFLMDITSDFIESIDVKVDIDAEKYQADFYWFCLFINGKWKAIGWGKAEKGLNTVIFENIPVGLTGIACTYRDGQLYPVSKLVTVTSNGPVEIRPDHFKGDISVTRKFPAKALLFDFVMANTGAVIEGSDEPDFHHPVILGEVKDTLGPFFQDFELAVKGFFRYYRIRTTKWALQIAELEFLSRQPLPGTSEASPLPVFSPGEPPQPVFYKFDGQMLAERPDSSAFDGNMLTYSSKMWVGMDMGRRVTVDRIRVAPRNANNGIVPGNRYQLLYWDGRWVPHSTTVATHNYVTFGEVAGNTLYWLRNLDHGREEQPFFYSGGKQVFANQ